MEALVPAFLLAAITQLCDKPAMLTAILADRYGRPLTVALAAGFAHAAGNFAAGLIAAATGAEGIEGAAETAASTPETYHGVYTTVGWVAVGVGVAVILISPLIKKLMHLDTLRDEPELAGYKELGEKEGPGMFPQAETKPGREEY